MLLEGCFKHGICDIIGNIVQIIKNIVFAWIDCHYVFYPGVMYTKLCLQTQYREINMESKTLYVSDLDGTLLRSNETTSDYTNEVINKMTEQGIMFSYATVRSMVSAPKVTKGLDAKIPLIVYNGAFIIDNQTGEMILENFFEEGIDGVLQDLVDNGVYPIVYTFINGIEQFLYIPEKSSKEMLEFITTRKNDRRKHPVKNKEELQEGKSFYITCIDLPEKLFPLYGKYKDKYHCIYQKDIYSGAQWLEIMPHASTKANAARELKTLLGCNRVVVFGDGMNDIEMFQMADECYAVANAVPELKEIATDVIGGNNSDGVAAWLEKNVLLKSNPGKP